jgi:antitoxin component YwqK of YwqJK toxin-antitoxin module
MADEATEPKAFQAPASVSDASAITADSEPKVEVIQERYANASVRIERSVTLDDDGNYINHGPWAGWDEAGRLVAKGEYKLNLPHGHWVKFFKAGEGNIITGAMLKEFSAPFVSEAGFEDGLLHGTWTITDAKDRKICEMNFEHDIQQGPMIWYYSNGQKSHESLYKDGKLEGLATDFAADGKVTGKAVYLDGRKLGTEVEYYAPGKKKSERAFSYAVARTTYNFFECTVKTAPVAENKDKQAHGASTWWFQNGQKQLEGTYKHNVPIGVFTWWYSNGQKQSEGAYVDGVQDGHWVRWHENGQKQWIGGYVMGERTGKWPEWKADGKVVAIEDFSTATLVDGSAKSTTSATVDGSKPELPGPAARSARTPTTKGRR